MNKAFAKRITLF